MIVEMQSGAPQQYIDAVMERARSLGFDVQLNIGTDKVVVAILGSDTGSMSTDMFAVLPGVEQVTRIMRPYKLASREFHKDPTLVPLGGEIVGGNKVLLIAGPCAVESHEQLLKTAQHVKRLGATALRGGAYKPRSSPFSFQGLGAEGLRILAEVKREVGLPIVSEVTAPHYLDAMVDVVDVLQVGARNMPNYALLRAVGQCAQPIILKRGLAATMSEWLQAADYVLAAGGNQLMLCERGIRTFETATRFTLDVASVGIIKRSSHLPVLVDPSHAAGHYQLVPMLARAAVAAGADGLLIEVHPDPANAMSDGLQSLTFNDSERLVKELRAIAAAVGREL